MRHFFILVLLSSVLFLSFQAQASDDQLSSPRTQGDAGTQKRSFPYGKKLRLRREGYGSLTDGQGIIISGPRKNAQASATTGPTSNVNPILWSACLDTLKFMPLASSDAVGGVLVTDWYTDPQNPHQRFKVTVRLQGVNFEPHNMTVQVHSQTQNKDGSWGVTLNDSQTALKIEEIIVKHGKTLYARAHSTPHP